MEIAGLISHDLTHGGNFPCSFAWHHDSAIIVFRFSQSFLLHRDLRNNGRNPGRIVFFLNKLGLPPIQKRADTGPVVFLLERRRQFQLPVASYFIRERRQNERIFSFFRNYFVQF